MAIELPFDLVPSDYATAPPGLDVASTLALGHRLLSVAPADLPAHAGVSRDLLRSSLTLLGHTYGLLQSADPGQPRRPVDLRTDNSWSCVKSRLEPWTWLDEGDSKDVLPARELWRKLFPGGSLSFTTLDYNAQWAEASWRIELLTREHLTPLLRRLVGDVFVDQLLTWHARYTAMIGISDQAADRDGKSATKGRPGSGKARSRKAAEPPGKPDGAAELAHSLPVGELRRRAQQAIVGWQLTLVTLHLSGHPGARAALAPTDEFRERALSGSRSPAEPAPSDPTAPPAPPVPEAPASPASA